MFHAAFLLDYKIYAGDMIFFFFLFFFAAKSGHNSRMWKIMCRLLTHTTGDVLCYLLIEVSSNRLSQSHTFLSLTFNTAKWQIFNFRSSRCSFWEYEFFFFVFLGGFFSHCVTFGNPQSTSVKSLFGKVKYLPAQHGRSHFCSRR